MTFQIHCIKRGFLVVGIVLAFNPLFSQQISIAGTVADQDGTGIESATVSLLKSADSTFFRAELTGTDGRFEFLEIPTGGYFVAATMLGFEKAVGKSFNFEKGKAPLEIEKINLRESADNLGEVTITAKKPLFERRIDRTIVNIENSILATGSSALDILERSPGVIVDQNDAISMRGRAGVIVMLDGKPNPMSGADLANFLRTMPSNSIERIELITNPSAKYDAAGNAGIIDIRLKKDKNLGTNGSFSTNYAQGVYPKISRTTSSTLEAPTSIVWKA